MIEIIQNNIFLLFIYYLVKIIIFLIPFILFVLSLAIPFVEDKDLNTLWKIRLFLIFIILAIWISFINLPIL